MSDFEMIKGWMVLIGMILRGIIRGVIILLMIIRRITEILIK